MTPAHLEHPTAFSCCGTLVRLWCQKATQRPVCDQDFIFFPLKVMQIIVGESNRNWGFVAGGWSSTQLSPRTGDASGVCQWLGTSPGHRAGERVLSAPLPWHRGRCHQHHWALPLPWPHSATVSALFPSWETQQETHRGVEVKCGITSSLLTRVQNTFLQGCTHDWTVPPIRVSALGLPEQ